jgi:hypothetical protein
MQKEFLVSITLQSIPNLNIKERIKETFIKTISKTTHEKFIKNLFINSLPHLNVIANLPKASAAISSFIILLPHLNLTLLIISLNFLIYNYLFSILIFYKTI